MTTFCALLRFPADLLTEYAGYSIRIVEAIAEGILLGWRSTRPRPDTVTITHGTAYTSIGGHLTL